MKRHALILFAILLLISCNASILMTNGEITKPGNNTGSDTSGSSTAAFSKEAPTGVNATKSYYENYIAISWNKVTGADYYTLEKSERDNSDIATASDVWTTIGQTVTDTSYKDESASLAVNKYYSYRVTAHTYTGDVGATSDISVGTLLASPETLSATKGTSESAIVVSWTQMPYVESYEVYKSDISSITGLKSELVDTLNADEDEAVRYYSYVIDPAKEKGRELYFAVVGVGPTGEKATISFSRSGYTLVPGAPSKPAVSVSKGEKSDSVDVHFKASGDDSEFAYVIKRTSAGSAESIVFSTEYNDISTLSKDENGNYIFEDTEVKPNVEYTYSVTAQNDIGISQAGIDYGYVISTVKNLSLVANKDRFGYDISYTLPVGASDSARTASYTYVVTRTLKNGTRCEDEVYTEDEFKSFDAFISVDKNPTIDSEKNEVAKIEIYVENADGIESAVAASNTIKSLPLPVTEIKATSFDKPLDGDSANSSGVYPVHVNWTTEATTSQTITRSGSDGSVKTFSAKDSFDDTTTSPLVIYDYYIDTTDELGRTLGEVKHASNSYGAVTPSVFIDIFESAGLKPWERQSYVPEEYKQYWKKSRIATLVGYGNASDLSTQTKALDSAEDKDHYRDSKITYSASMEGIGGQIYFTYSSFGENANFYINGNYEMHVNASGTGSAKSSTNGLDILGMYKGHISLEKISVKNKAFTGTYVFSIDYSNGSVSGYEVDAK